MRAELPPGPFNLPPGVSIRDVDPPMRTCANCEGAGVLVILGEDGMETEVCVNCNRCNGAGEIPE